MYKKSKSDTSEKKTGTGRRDSEKKGEGGEREEQFRVYWSSRRGTVTLGR